MLTFNDKTLCFEINNKDNKYVYSLEKVSKNGVILIDNYLSEREIGNLLNTIGSLYYKNQVIKAMSILNEKGLEDDEEFITFEFGHLNSGFEINLVKSQFSYESREDIGTLYKLGKLESLNESKDTKIKNLFLQTIKNTSKLINRNSHNKDKKEHYYPSFSLFNASLGSKNIVKDVIIWQLNQFSNTYNNLSEIKKLKKTISEIFNKDSFDIKKLEDCIFNNLKIAKSYSLFFKILEELKFTLKNTKTIEKTNEIDNFTYRFDTSNFNAVGIKKKNIVRLLCFNHINEQYKNNTNTKLINISQNSPALIDILSDPNFFIFINDVFNVIKNEKFSLLNASDFFQVVKDLNSIPLIDFLFSSKNNCKNNENNLKELKIKSQTEQLEIKEKEKTKRLKSKDKTERLRIKLEFISKMLSKKGSKEKFKIIDIKEFIKNK